MCDSMDRLWEAEQSQKNHQQNQNQQNQNQQIQNQQNQNQNRQKKERFSDVFDQHHHFMNQIQVQNPSDGIKHHRLKTSPRYTPRSRKFMFKLLITVSPF